MKILKFILPFIILLSIFGCEKKEVSDSDFEKDVMKSVFVEIVDSIYMDRRIMMPPPSPRYANFKKNIRDTVGFHKELKEYWHYQDSIKKDKSRILISVHDFVVNNKIRNEKFDLTPFKNNKKFNFQYASKFPKEEFWDLNDIYSKMPVSTIEISNIHFNKTKTSGTLQASASCGGGKCGQGFEITIELKNGKWHVTKIIDTWSS